MSNGEFDIRSLRKAIRSRNTKKDLFFRTVFPILNKSGFSIVDNPIFKNIDLRKDARVTYNKCLCCNVIGKSNYCNPNQKDPYIYISASAKKFEGCGDSLDAFWVGVPLIPLICAIQDIRKDNCSVADYGLISDAIRYFKEYLKWKVETKSGKNKIEIIYTRRTSFRKTYSSTRSNNFLIILNDLLIEYLGIQKTSGRSKKAGNLLLNDYRNGRKNN